MNATPNYLELTGKVCVVTGAGSGIGRAVALALGREGAAVAVLDRDAGAANAVAADIRALGAKAEALVCDVSDERSVREVAARCAASLGPCDVLFNNAGILRGGSMAEMPLADWNAVLQVNLTGAFIVAQTFGQQMLARQRGSIIHTASIAASFATLNAGAYSVAKAGIAALSRQLAMEWGPLGVRSNAVCPGMTLTPLTQAAYNSPGQTAARSKLIPAGRIGRPEEIAEAVLFLASDRSSYTNGAELTIDGAFTRNLMALVPRTV